MIDKNAPKQLTSPIFIVVFPTWVLLTIGIYIAVFYYDRMDLLAIPLVLTVVLATIWRFLLVVSQLKNGDIIYRRVWARGTEKTVPKKQITAIKEAIGWKHSPFKKLKTVVFQHETGERKIYYIAPRPGAYD